MSVLWTYSQNDSIVWGPNPYVGTFTAPGSSAVVVKEIAVDFSALPNDGDKLFLIVNSGKRNNLFGKINEVWIGGTSGVRNGTRIASYGSSSTGGFVDIIPGGVTTAILVPFTNPNPSGTSFIKFAASGAGGGWQDLNIEIHHGMHGGQGFLRDWIPPWEDFGAQPLKVTFTGKVRGASFNFMELSGLKDSDTDPDGGYDGDPFGLMSPPDGSVDWANDIVFEDRGFYGGTAHDPFGTFDSPAVPGRLRLRMGVTPFDFTPQTGYVKDYTITVETLVTPPSPPVVPPRPVPVSLPRSSTPTSIKAKAVDPLGFGLIRPFRRTEHQDFATASGPALVLACVVQVLGTPLGTFPWEPSFGSNLFRLRHKTQEPTFFDLARIYSDEAIRKWEPRAGVITVEVEESTVPVGQRNSVGLIAWVKIGGQLFPAAVRV